MYRNFLEKTVELRPKVAQKKLTIEEWVTIASMIEKETFREEEKPLIYTLYTTGLKKNETPDKINSYIRPEEKGNVEGRPDKRTP
ncbi:MAG: hypothetical protein Q9N34_07570 [Aquificota bacterium]|nr:hypothetical protein [Aquificota bacterium]